MNRHEGHRHGGLDRREFLTGTALLCAMATFTPGFIAQALAQDAQPKNGGTLKLGMSGGATSDSLDPRTLTDWVPVNICYQVMNGLIEIDEHNKAVPELLESWESKPGAKDWVFDVRKGVKFSNGKTLDADDIIYSINLHRGDTKSPGKVVIEDVTDVKKLGPNQIGITMGQGNVDLPYLLSDYHFMVVPNGFTDWAKPIGTAGYVLESFDPGVRAVTRKHGDYWKPGRAFVDSIETDVINDTSARTNALITGQVDVISRLNPRTVNLLKKNPNFQVIVNEAGQHATFLMNTTDKPYTDNNVRLALKYGVDRQKMIDTVLNGYGVVGNDQPIPNTDRFYAADLPKHTYDPDKAKFYLKQAGLSELPVTFQVSEAAFTGATDAALLYQAAVAKAGIAMNVKREPSDGYWDNVWLKAPFCVSYWGGRPTADQMLSIAYKSDAKWNETYWKRPEFDRILIAARTEGDEAKRKQMYGDLQRMISEDAGAVIPMFMDYLEAGSKKVKGMGPHPMFDLMAQRIGEKVWIEAEHHMPDATVEVTENLWISLADGTRLAARLWRPSGPERVPAVLEYIPYRKRDGTRGRDEPMHGFFAAQGYAAIRVDMRGSGESDGLLDDEYLKQEQDDALEVIAWVAAQPWCSGAVGMMGKSWGGFNALQVAARRPPALKAIITVCSTDDRFADDIHFMGGCLLNDNLWWGAIMLAYQGRPPDPALRNDWHEQWLARLDHMPFWPALWLKHQSRDDYWRHGSVCEDWDAITCPVLAVGGWADSYTNAVPRLLTNLRVPRLGIIGPWAHIYPQDGSPGPAIDFLGEATRWWDHWLRGRDTGIMAEPMLRAFIEDYAPPSTTRKTAPGRFVGEAVWPSPAIREKPFFLSPGQLLESPAESTTLSVRSPLWTGTGAGEWMGTGIAGEMPADQRQDDGLSLLFNSGPLEQDIEVLGNPVLELKLSADRPDAQIAVRLCDVAPDGASLRVSYAVLNLAHRNGWAEPQPMRPGEPAVVRVTLKVCGHRFPAGHRIRLAVSSSYWPLVWPARHSSTLSIDPGPSRLVLPARDSNRTEAPVRFEGPRHGPHAPYTALAQSRLERRVTFDVIGGTAIYTTVGEGGIFGEGVLRWDDIDTTLAHDVTRILAVQADDPLSAESTVEQSYRMGRPGWQIRIDTTTSMTANAERFRLTGTLRAYENDTLVRTRQWSEDIRRENL